MAGDEFMPEMHLRRPAVFNKNKKQPGFTYSACGPFNKKKKKKELKELWRVEIQIIFTKMN